MAPEPELPLAEDARRTWSTLASVLPPELYLGGGTAVAVHLHHRVSADLDFFYHHHAVDLRELGAALARAGDFAVLLEGAGTLRGVFEATKLDFLHADELRAQTLLDEPAKLAGLRVAGLRDLLAMKLKLVRERGELRDYYDIKEIEERGGLSVEDGLAFFMERHGLGAQDVAIGQIVQALGYLDDLEEDESVPISRESLGAWWAKRQATLVKRLARNPLP